MNEILASLVRQMDLEQLEVNLFRGQSTDMWGPRVFGGQVIGQALIASEHTIEGRVPHSLHGYFLRPGLVDRPVIFHVDRDRDGIAEIEFGPVMAAGGIKPKAVFRWDKAKQTWAGPEAKPGDHFRVLAPDAGEWGRYSKDLQRLLGEDHVGDVSRRESGNGETFGNGLARKRALSDRGDRQADRVHQQGAPQP